MCSPTIHVKGRPTCINHGCDMPVCAKSGKVTDPDVQWRPVCGNCQTASYGGTGGGRQKPRAFKEGVTPFITGKCSNLDGHLGFKCMTNWDNVPADAKGMTEIDHIDGNSSNNTLENTQELCVLDHKYKGQLAGDFNSNRPTTAQQLAT